MDDFRLGFVLQLARAGLGKPRALAVDAVRAVLETQYPNGNIPNWRSRFGGTPDRSQPPVGAYCRPQAVPKDGRPEPCSRLYPVLRKWHAFWKARKPNGQARRDGNGDGLLEWGSDIELVTETRSRPGKSDATGEQRAKWESGQDDLPNWDDVPYNPETGTLTMNCVDLNSLYALDAWCLSQIADMLGRRDEAEAYQAEYEQMRELINDQLWNSREDFYFDRLWDGRFSPRKAASNFYPLLARIPDERQAQLMLKHLFVNPQGVLGRLRHALDLARRSGLQRPQEPGTPVLAGDDLAADELSGLPGLKAYGFDDVASEFAAKKRQALFMRAWTNFQLCPENFHPLTGEAAGQRFQSWGPLFASEAVEEYLDFTPWEGFRFGMLDPEQKGTAPARPRSRAGSYDVEIVPKGEIALREDEPGDLHVDGGAVIRHFLYSENEVSFEISAKTLGGATRSASSSSRKGSTSFSSTTRSTRSSTGVLAQVQDLRRGAPMSRSSSSKRSCARATDRALAHFGGQVGVLQRIAPDALPQGLEGQDLLGRDIPQIDVRSEAEDEVLLLVLERALPRSATSGSATPATMASISSIRVRPSLSKMPDALARLARLDDDLAGAVGSGPRR